ncbi:hypothetical protein HPC49_24830 [Pyxidicoccus fallax]|uniref:Lipoprotein n=1 Tax=Pyxidicoccus fallax TaxID=394095 RepID=A0A848LHN5_9BACT|nr:hypothetical protein [Pyxidicoccus fallax]NMO16941.1 hypothetical protein [Pyxidicoccus fallax]NPC81441.1 hypothetical protein [Pyxidicoccus fallax]
MRQLGSTLLALSMLAGCGSADFESSSESPSTGSQQAALTSTDVDVAPECQGIITFVNGASFATLDAYLPSDVVTRLVAQRATAPFATLAQVSAVQGMGPARLEQLEGGARAQSYIGPSCVGIMDSIAVSADDDAAIVSLVNSVSSTELHDILPSAWNGAEALLGLRPFTSAQAIADVGGIGDSSLRSLRNAATLSRPFDTLVDAVRALPNNGNYGVTLARHFDWWNIVTTNGTYNHQLVCFGLEPNSVPYYAEVRDGLATPQDVRDAVAGTVAAANADANGAIPASVISAGLANLHALTEGRLFKGCEFSYSNDPWSNNSIYIFVDNKNGFGVITGSWWAE